MPATLERSEITRSIDPKKGARVHPEDEKTRSSQKKSDVTNVLKNINDRFAGNILEVPEVNELVQRLATETNIDRVRRSMKELMEYVDLVLSARNLKIKELTAELNTARSANEQQALNVLPPTVEAERRAGKATVLKFSKAETQTHRDQVRAMVAREKPINNVPTYDGKKIHGDAVKFFKKHYAPYIAPGCEVIFAPDLKAIDEKLLIALRNECRDGVPVPIGTRSDRTDALIEGRFVDEKFSARKAHLAIAFRELRNANAEPIQAEPA